MKKFTALLLTLLLLTAFVGCKNTREENSATRATITNTDDIILKIGDTEIKSYPLYSDLEKADFEQEHAELKKEYEAESFFGCYLSDGKNSVYVDFKNDSNETVKLKDMAVKSLYVYSSDANFSLSENINQNSTPDEVKKAYGDPNSTDSENGALTYKNSDGSSVEFYFNGEGIIDYICFTY